MTRFINLETQYKQLGFNFVAGIDEAGRGPLAGPVVSAAVILKANARIPGLKNSKLLTPQQREKLFNIIIGQSIDYSISIVSHQHIDRVNIYRATLFANYLCVEYMRTKPDIVLIDGRDKQYLNTPFKTVIKGDDKIKSIAAASVLAKVVRDRIMDEFAMEFNMYGFENHKGYGTREHRANLLKYGKSEIHRKTFNFKI